MNKLCRVKMQYNLSHLDWLPVKSSSALLGFVSLPEQAGVIVCVYKTF